MAINTDDNKVPIKELSYMNKNEKRKIERKKFLNCWHTLIWFSADSFEPLISKTCTQVPCYEVLTDSFICAEPNTNNNDR